MSTNVLMIFLGWFFALAFFFSFIVLLRYLQHRERMELIRQGINPIVRQQRWRSRRMLRAGLITAMVGLALTVGLYPLGFILPLALTTAPFRIGPWLLPGLIPLAVGIALIGSYYLEQSNQPADDEKQQEHGNVTLLEEHRRRERPS